MKKILLGTTAMVALATFSTQASAADPISLSVGGYMVQSFVVGDHNQSGANPVNMSMGQVNDTEIHFSGSTELDNGLTVSVKVELEGQRDTSADESADNSARIDSTFATVSSPEMGSLTIGQTTTSYTDNSIGATAVGRIGKYRMNVAFNGYTAASVTASAKTDNFRNTVIKYVSPSFNGVNVHATYVPSTTISANTVGAVRADTNDAIAAGVTYKGDMGGASVKAEISHLSENGASNTTRVGASVSTAGFTVGGAYATQTDDSHTGGVADVNDGKSWELGVGYTMGALGLSATYWNHKSDGTAAAGERSDKTWSIAASYDLGGSVKVIGEYVKVKAADSEAAATYTDYSDDSFVASLSVGF